MKTNQSSDTNGTPLSYTANGRKNEIAINDYKNFNLKIGRTNVGYAAIFFSFFHSTFFNCIQTKKGPKLEKIRNNLSHQPEKKQPTVHDATSYKCHFSTLSLERFFSYFLTSTLWSEKEAFSIFLSLLLGRSRVMGFCSGLSAGYLDLSPTSGNAWSPFFFFLIWGPAVRKKISYHGNLILSFSNQQS